MRITIRPSLLLAVSWALLGCGSDSPAEKCDDLVDLLCTKIQTCGEQLTRTTAPANFHKQCLDTQRTETDCSKAVAVDSSYDRCMSELSDATCSVFLTVDATRTRIVSANIPASCRAVIKFP